MIINEESISIQKKILKYLKYLITGVLQYIINSKYTKILEILDIEYVQSEIRE